MTQKARFAVWTFVGAVALGGGLFWFSSQINEDGETDSNTNSTNSEQVIVNEQVTFRSFLDCVAAGYPVQESYPRRCVAEGETFTEEIGNELELTDSIQISEPRPNDLVTLPLSGKGEARGVWFFEANFPVRLEDEEGNLLGQTIAQASGEWMTNDFVPFSFRFADSIQYSGSAWLVLEKANPSGLDEEANALRLPLQLE